MTSELEQYLSQAGFSPRQSQTDLYEHLIQADKRGVVSQAGTGTGKSAAIISAAAHQARAHGSQSLIVTPTLTLMNQYRDGDLPIAYEAFGDLVFAELRGRPHYWCEMTASSYDVLGMDYVQGCDGADAGCSKSAPPKPACPAATTTPLAAQAPTAPPASRSAARRHRPRGPRAVRAPWPRGGRRRGGRARAA